LITRREPHPMCFRFPKGESIMRTIHEYIFARLLGCDKIMMRPRLLGGSLVADSDRWRSVPAVGAVGRQFALLHAMGRGSGREHMREGTFHGSLP
jgi:hypothetical protein